MAASGFLWSPMGPWSLWPCAHPARVPVPSEQSHSIYSIFFTKEKNESSFSQRKKQSCHSPCAWLGSRVLGGV